MEVCYVFVVGTVLQRNVKDLFYLLKLNLLNLLMIKCARELDAKNQTRNFQKINKIKKNLLRYYVSYCVCVTPTVNTQSSLVAGCQHVAKKEN